jgi:hypothetical protein
MIDWPGSLTITFDPPLPCSTWLFGRLCGKPATVATIYPTGGSMYIMQPICKDCVAGLAKVCLGDEKKASRE